MESITIRGMKLEDLAKVLEIENACFTVPWSKEAFIKELKTNLLAKYYVLQVDGEIVAYGGMWMVMDEGHITNIAVHPHQQGKKYGKRLVEHMIHQSKTLGLNQLTLEVRRSNMVAQGLYKALGFLPCGIRPNYYYDNGEDAIIMWKDL